MKVRSMVFTLYGDYAQHPEDEIWLGSMIRLFREFGVSDPAIRSAASRMAREGWLKVRRIGRQSYYSLTQKGWALIQEGRRRIRTRRQEPWDGRWCFFAYSIPQATPALRDRLRKELSWLGFGHLANGLWISPNDRTAELQELVKKYPIQPYIHIFLGRYLGTLSDRELVERCWNLHRVNEEYRHFIAQWEPRLRAFEEACSREEPWPENEAFKLRFLLTHEFRKFPFSDPDLPPELVPPGWKGHEALRLYLELYTLLGQQAWSFFYRSQPYPPAPEGKKIEGVRREDGQRGPS